MIELDLSSPVTPGADSALLRMDTIREYSENGTGYLIEHIEDSGYRFVRIEENIATAQGDFGQTLGHALATARSDWTHGALPRGPWAELLRTDSIREERFESRPVGYRAAKYFHSTVDELVCEDLIYLVQKDGTTGLFHFISIDGNLEEDFHSPESFSLRSIYREMAQHARETFEFRRYQLIHFKLIDRDSIPKHIPAEEWLAADRILAKFPELAGRKEEVTRVVGYMAKLLPGRNG